MLADTADAGLTSTVGRLVLQVGRLVLQVLVLQVMVGWYYNQLSYK